MRPPQLPPQLQRTYRRMGSMVAQGRLEEARRIGALIDEASQQFCWCAACQESGAADAFSQILNEAIDDPTQRTLSAPGYEPPTGRRTNTSRMVL